MFTVEWAYSAAVEPTVGQAQAATVTALREALMNAWDAHTAEGSDPELTAAGLALHRWTVIGVRPGRPAAHDVHRPGGVGDDPPGHGGLGPQPSATTS